MISVALFLYPGLRLALQECKQWRSWIQLSVSRYSDITTASILPQDRLILMMAYINF